MGGVREPRPRPRLSSPPFLVLCELGGGRGGMHLGQQRSSLAYQLASALVVDLVLVLVLAATLKQGEDLAGQRVPPRRPAHDLGVGRDVGAVGGVGAAEGSPRCNAQTVE